jgi:hypothetical protein
MQKILLKLLVVAAISSTSFAQTKILSFTSSATIAQNPALPWGLASGDTRPYGSFATVGSNKFLAIAFNYATNKTSFNTNKESGKTVVTTNQNTPCPLGVAYVFKFTSSNVVNPSPVLALTNTNNHTYYFAGSYIPTSSSTNSIGISYFTAAAVTNIGASPTSISNGLYTNITTDYWGKETSVLLSTTNDGITWSTNQTLGTVKTNFIAATGSYVPNPNRSFWVNIVKGTNGKAVFDVYNP